MWISKWLFRALFNKAAPQTIADALYRSVMLDKDVSRQAKMRFIIHKLDTQLKIFYGETTKKEPG